MGKMFVTALTVGAFCALTASAQIPVPSVMPDGSAEVAGSQNWVFGTCPDSLAECEVYDNGTTTNCVGWIPGEFAWLSVFQAGDDCNLITHIETRVCQSSFVGRPLTVYVWNDPSGLDDRDPGDTTMPMAQGTAIPVDTGVFQIALDTPVCVEGYYWIGALVQTIGPAGGEFPAPYDTSALPVCAKSWLVANDPGINVNDIASSAGFAPADFWDPGVFIHGVWTLRPIIEAGANCGSCDPCDMNCDGAVNAFDIEPFLDLLFGPVPDPCNTCTGDVNGDGVVDAFDIEPFLNCLFP